MRGLVMETDLGHDPDDLFALLLFIAVKAPLAAVCLSPGDPYQVAIARAVLDHFALKVPVLTPKARVPKEKAKPGFHAWVVEQLGGAAVADADGHEELLPKEPVDVFVCGPVRMAHLVTPSSITVQGGFVPYALHRPRVVLEKFEGHDAFATFNLGGTKPAVQSALIDADVPHRWVGKNVCHTVVYTPEVHARFAASTPSSSSLSSSSSSSSSSEALRLHSAFMARYLDKHGRKAFHDPLAALLHVKPEIGRAHV